MKRQFLFLVMALLSMTASAQSSVNIDGIYYTLNSVDKTAEVTRRARYKYSGDVVIPSSVTYEGVDYGVTSIGNEAFALSTDLTSISIPVSVTTIGDQIFFKCTGLTTIVIEEGNTVYDSRENSNAIIETASNTLLLGCKGTTIPNSVTTIGSMSFSGVELTSIIIPNSVTSIGEKAFYECLGLASVTIGSGVTTIGKQAFENCSNLKRVEINNNAIVSKKYDWERSSSIKDIFGIQVEEYVLGEDVTSIGNSAFYDCPYLTSFYMSDNVTSIGENAFRECWRLSSFRISANVTSIGDFAFKMCYGLTSITIPSGMTEIEHWTFDGCALKRVEINSNALISKDYEWNSLANLFGPVVEEYVLGEEITSIGKNAFNSSSVISINIPQNVTSIGEAAFAGCCGLPSIHIPANVTSIGANAFNNCPNLTSIQVENGNTAYDSRENCNALIETATNTILWGCQNTFIPNTVSTIGDNAFYMCSGLNSLDIPNSVTAIGENAFAGCNGLTVVSIPNSVTTIGKYAFSHCEQLTGITIPNNVTSIDEGTFFSCTGLTSITIPNSVTSINDRAFHSCTNLTSISIPNGVTSIGKNTFFDCSELATLVIPNSITTIGDNAFMRSGLTDMYCYAEQLPEIGSSIFQDTYHKTTLHVPAGSVDAYSNAEQWKEFPNIVALTDSDPSPTGIMEPTTTQQPAFAAYYDLSGRLTSQPQRGLNIIKMCDGTTKKVLVK